GAPSPRPARCRRAWTRSPRTTTARSRRSSPPSRALSRSPRPGPLRSPRLPPPRLPSPPLPHPPRSPPRSHRRRADQGARLLAAPQVLAARDFRVIPGRLEALETPRMVKRAVIGILWTYAAYTGWKLGAGLLDLPQAL